MGRVTRARPAWRRANASSSRSVATDSGTAGSARAGKRFLNVLVFAPGVFPASAALMGVSSEVASAFSRAEFMSVEAWGRLFPVHRQFASVNWFNLNILLN